MKRHVFKRGPTVACMFLACFLIFNFAWAEGTLVSETEDLGARGPTTRAFSRTYEIPVLDEAGNPTGETFLKTRRMVEKADGLCYDASLHTNEAVTPPPPSGN